MKVAELREKKGATAAQTMEEIDSKGTNYARKMIPLIKRNEEGSKTPKEGTDDDAYMWRIRIIKNEIRAISF